MGIAAGPDGNLWFTEWNWSNIGRITTAGVITEFPIPTANSAPMGIAAGSDGSLWFTEWNWSNIGRITTAGVITEFPILPPVGLPAGIAAGPDAALWFTEVAQAGDHIGRITTPASERGEAVLFDEPTRAPRSAEPRRSKP